MASEVRVNSITNRSGLGTATFNNDGSITVAGNLNLNSVTTTGRNAGVGTATGAVIYNTTDEAYQGYFGNTLGWQTIKSGFSATGGTEIVDGSSKYHVFTSPGTFIVSGSADIEFLLVAGGGAMTSAYGSGGGAGGISHSTAWPVSTASYAVVVGSGGVSAGPPNTGPGAIDAHGDDSTFNGVTSVGGGVGFHDALETPQPWTPQINGGSGGGTGDDSSGGAGTGTQPAQPTHGGLVTNYGFPGFAPELGNGPGTGNQNCGGGGASEGGAPAGTPGPTVTFNGPGDRQGGDGQAFPSFPAPVLAPAIPAPVRPAWTPAVGPTGLFGGGGGGAGNTPGPYAGGAGGGGAGTSTPGTSATPGVDYTGGGGGAIFNSGTGGNGGDGIFIIRYPI